jgi:hypothetical protein
VLYELEYDLTTSSYHEAGHALMAVRLRLPMSYVTVDPPFPGAGGGADVDVDHKRSPEDAEKMALVCLGGWAGVFEMTGDEDKAAEGCGLDFRLAQEALNHWGLRAEYEPTQDRARALMKEPKNRRALERLAQRLRDDKRLSGEEARRVVEESDAMEVASAS